MTPEHGPGSGANLHPIVWGKATYGTTWVERVAANWYRVARMNAGGTRGVCLGYTNNIEEAKRWAQRKKPLGKRR